MFSNVVTVALNYGEIESHPERVSKIKPFINKYKWNEINCQLRKIIQQFLLIFCILKKEKYVQLISQKLIRIVKKNYINDSKRRRKKAGIILQ